MTVCDPPCATISRCHTQFLSDRGHGSHCTVSIRQPFYFDLVHGISSLVRTVHVHQIHAYSDRFTRCVLVGSWCVLVVDWWLVG